MKKRFFYNEPTGGNSSHRLRSFVDNENEPHYDERGILRPPVEDKSIYEPITDAELDEVYAAVDFGSIDENHEYAGNFIITRDLATRDEAVTNMCCGIKTQDIKLSSGQVLYFAFDYGH